MLNLVVILVIGFNHSFHKYFLIAYYMKKTIPGSVEDKRDDWNVSAF